MVKQVYQLTQEGLDALTRELQVLKDVKREENKEALREARAQGDLSENADYDAARNEQARIEARIAEIETIIKNAKIIKATNDDIINIGKVVTVRYLDRDQKQEFHLISSIEADPSNRKISIDSPIGKALKNHQKGDTVLVKSETGKTFYLEILDVK